MDYSTVGMLSLIKVNYIVADKQAVTRAGMISFIEEVTKSPNVFEANSYEDLLVLLRKYPDSIVIVDYSLFNFQSVTHMLNIKSGAKESDWLLFTDEPQAYFLRQLLLADSSISVVLKHNTKSDIIHALKSISSGEVYWCEIARSVMKVNVQKERIPDQLTASEKIILREIALGKTTKEIASEKNLSFHTVNTHRRNIYHKLEVNSVNEATRFALQAGLIDLMEYYI